MPWRSFKAGGWCRFVLPAYLLLGTYLPRAYYLYTTYLLPIYYLPIFDVLSVVSVRCDWRVRSVLGRDLPVFIYPAAKIHCTLLSLGISAALLHVGGPLRSEPPGK